MPSILKFLGNPELLTFRKEEVWQVAHFCEHIRACVAAYGGVKRSGGCLLTYSYRAVLGVPWCSEGCRGSCGVGGLLHAAHWGQRRHQRRSAGVLKVAVRFNNFGSSCTVASIWKGLDFGLMVPVWLTTEAAQAVSPGWTQVEQPSLTSLSSHCYFPIPKCCLCPLTGLVVRVCSNLLTSCRETSWFFE